MDTKISWLQWLGIIIPASPALGYGLAYVRELGYCNFYKIPSEFIKLDWTTILVAIAASLAALLLLGWLVTILVLSKLGNINPLRRKIGLSILLFVFMFYIAIRYLTIEESKQLGIIFAFFLACIFIMPWFIRNYAGTKVYRPSSADTQNKDEVALFFKRLVDNQYFRYGFIVIYIIGVLFAFSYLDGRSAAMDKQNFYVPSTNSQSVVLKIYGDNLICAPLVQHSNVFSQQYFIINMNNSNVTLMAVHFGYLRANENMFIPR